MLTNASEQQAATQDSNWIIEHKALLSSYLLNK